MLLDIGVTLAGGFYINSLPGDRMMNPMKKTLKSWKKRRMDDHFDSEAVLDMMEEYGGRSL